MNAREELAAVIHDSLYPGAYREDRMTWPQGIYVEADAILAAGYSKPRTITTAEELDALPVGSVVRTDFGCTVEKDCDFGSGKEFWSNVGSEDRRNSGHIALPATLIYQGGAA